jgi:TldD protein
MKEELDLDLLDKLLKSVEKNVDYADIRVNESENTVIVMKDGKIQEIRSGSDQGVCLRVLKQGAWGFSYTNQLDRLDNLTESALKLASVLTSDVELAPAEIRTDKVKSNARIKLSDVPLEDKKIAMSDVEQAANLDKVVSTTVNYVDAEGTTYFLNSEGSSIKMEETEWPCF